MNIIEKIDRFLCEKESSSYKKFFNAKMKKWGIDDPQDLDTEERKKFFDEVDREWKAKNESLSEQKGKWKGTGVKHPGVLEVPEGEDIESLSLSHFVNLAKKKGRSTIVKALMNLYRWNKNDDPKLSAWAKDMQEKLSAKLEKEGM